MKHEGEGEQEKGVKRRRISEE